MTDDDWVKEAMADTTLVAEVLLSLRKGRLSTPPPPPPASAANKSNNAPVLKLKWSKRQRRSKHFPRKKGDSARASPTTPLSWSGATSVSGGGGAAADGSEESSRSIPKPIDNPRSKVTGTNESTAPKRSRRKKTLAELKEEESSLLKERRYLTNALGSLRVKIEKERAQNEDLKRLKVDLLSRKATDPTTAFLASNDEISDKHERREVACNENDHSLPDCSTEVEKVGSRESSCLIPDLNLPLDNDSDPEVLYGIS